MTPAQKKWLKVLRKDGFVEAGWSMSNGQRNRPLNALVDMGFCVFGNEPEDSFLTTHGYVHVGMENEP